MKKEWYARKWITILIHALAWILLFSLPYLLRPSYNPNEAKPPERLDSNIFFIITLVSDALLIIFFYLNAGMLIPRFFYKKKYPLYFLSVIFSFSVYVVIIYILRINYANSDGNFSFNKHLFFSTFIFLFILSGSIAYKTIRDKIIADQLANEKEHEYLKTELALLRSQVSPHFMFNVLNNMVALARKKSDLLEPSLIKLSSLMRYMLYETDEEKVSLERETEYLQSYIALQQQRYGKKVVINVNIHSMDKMYTIEPMLLIPFVENAFKHGTGLIENAHIDIDMKAENNILYFSVSNKYDAESHEIKDKASGIGLANVQRRLQLLYPSKHELFIKKDDNLFTIKLNINIA
ncbi:MAG: histidine kinase [Bacteroidota bacterium]|nr:histidine kinase [Bacteroidota bacterium]